MDVYTILQKLILEKRSISISEFMNIALYHKECGYYTNNIPIYKDFITAPEISQMFGEVIAIWIVDSWIKMGSPSEIVLVEAGAGLGTMMLDITRVIQQFPKLYAKINIYIIEISPTLRHKQQKVLFKYLDKITWIKTFDEVPNKNIIFVANELFDAFAIDQFIYKENQWHEIKIKLSAESKLSFCETKIDHSNNVKQNALQGILATSGTNHNKDGDVLEISLEAMHLIQQINSRLNSNDVAAMIIDYGYLKRPYKSSLQSVQKNQYSNVLEGVGTSDITSLVDFNNFHEFEICTQRDFLFNFGIRERLDILIKENYTARETLIQGFKRLTDHSQMGNLFKVATKISASRSA